MYRFFAAKDAIADGKINISKEDINHIINVLRLKTGEEITVSDNMFTDYICKIKDLSKNDIILEIIAAMKNESEPSVKITLFQGLPKHDKMELIIQKCVELGIEKIVPVITQRSIVKMNDKADKKIERWQKIAHAAAMQSRRGKVPQIGEFLSFEEALRQMAGFDLSLMPYELENSVNMRQALRDFQGKTISILIGPEGGISKEEAEACKSEGMIPVTLGRRILRTETAGFAALTIILYELGDM